MKKIFKTLLVTPLLLLVGCGEDYDKYTCTYTEELVGMTNEVEVIMYHDLDKIKKVEIKKTYEVTSEEEEENLATFRWILDTENSGYEKKPGVKIRVHEDNNQVYSFTYVLNLDALDEEMYSIFGVDNSLEKQKSILNSKNNLVCK